MASYTRRYPNTGSTLTINYPDGLFSDIVDDPRTLYRVSQESELYYTPYDFDDQGNKIYKTDKDYGRQAYPDLILIPANGAFINERADKDEITTFRRFRKNDNGVWEKIDELIDETHKKADGDHYSISIGGTNPLWFRGSPNSLIDNRCYSCGEISIHESMEDNEIDYCVPSDLSEIYAYNTREKHITITIYGEAKFFKSNANHYFCAGRSETNGTLYCNSYFGEDKKIVGGFHIRDKDKKIIELRPVSLTNRGGRGSRYYACKGSNGETRVLDFSNCQEYYDYDDVVVPYQDSSDQELNYEDCFCEGFRFQRALNQFWGKNREIDGKPLFSEEQLTYRKSNIQFILEPIVAVSTGYAPHGWGTYLYLEPKGMETQFDDQGNEVLVVEKQPSIEIELNVDYDDEDSFSSGMNVWDNYKWNDDKTIFYIILFDKYTNYRRGRDKWATKYIFMPLSSFQIMGETINYIYGYDNSVGFSGYFTTCKGFWTPNQYLVAPWKDTPQNKNKNIPLYEYGVTLYPVMTKPQCVYFHLQCTKNTDPKNVMGDDDTNILHKRIKEALDIKYGKHGEYLYVKEREWIDWKCSTMIDRILKTKAKMKILFINSHGGKEPATDKSGAYLSHVDCGDLQTNIIEYDHIKYLLQNAKTDEYYAIISNACFGGGMYENYIHNNVNNPNYTIVDPSMEFSGANYFIQYGDNANSPSWGSSGAVSQAADLVDYTGYQTYQAATTEMNGIVSSIRAKNLPLLVDFLDNNYQYMRDILLVSGVDDEQYGHHWTADTYANSIHNHVNLITQYSRSEQSEQIEMMKTYPIVFCFWLVSKISNCISYFKTFKKFFKSEEGFWRYLRRFKKELPNQIKVNPYIYSLSNLQYNYNTGVQPDREFIIQLARFFFNLYHVYRQMSRNAEPATNRNSYYFTGGLLLDDIPGAILNGTNEFKNCEIFTYPGYDAQVLNNIISDESIQKMMYKGKEV